MANYDAMDAVSQTTQPATSVSDISSTQTQSSNGFFSNSTLQGISSTQTLSSKGFFSNLALQGISSTQTLSSNGFFSNLTLQGISSTQTLSSNGFFSNSTLQGISSTQTLSSNGFFSNSTIKGLVPPDCSIVSFADLEFLPWDNPDNVVSAKAEDITRRVKDAIILPLLFLIGGPGNVINMAVFYKQGLRERVNLCLFALSLADWLNLLQAMFLYGEQLYLWLTTMERYGPVITFMVNNNLVGFFGFAWVSLVLSAIIASERCLCVLCPLRSQTLLKTKTMAIIISGVFVVVVGLYFVVAARYHLDCAYDPESDTTTVIYVVSEFYQRHETLINYLDTFVYGAGIPVAVMVIVATTTTTTAMKIRQAARWRAESSARAISPRDVALTKMLIGTSLLFMVCVFPIAVFRCVWLFLPEINPGRRHHNLFFTGLWILDALSFVNSTFNICVYCTMGTRYRETFWTLFRGRKSNQTK